MKDTRLPELDSLRGIAALIVVFFHMLLLTVFRENGNSPTKQILVKLFTDTPLVIFNSGHQSVILFFVLSGFVLYLSFSKSTISRYSVYITRRFCRLYLPYILSVFFGYLMLRLLAVNGITPAWGTPVTLSIVLNHLLPIGMFSQKTFNPVIWSLVQEMRISIILPFVFYFVLNYNWRTVLYNGIVLSIIGITLHSLYDNVDVFTNYFDTLHYILMFIIGALLAKHLTSIREFFINLSVLNKLIILAISIYCYGYPKNFTDHIGGNAQFQLLLQDWFITIGCVVFIITAITSKVVSKILNLRIFIYFGKISYSVYLSHLVILYTWMSLAPVYLLTRTEVWVYTLICTFIVSTISYLLIEKPSMQLGRYLSKKVNESAEKKLSKNDQTVLL